MYYLVASLLLLVKPTDMSGRHPYRLEWRDKAFEIDQYFQISCIELHVDAATNMRRHTILIRPGVANVCLQSVGKEQFTKLRLAHKFNLVGGPSLFV